MKAAYTVILASILLFPLTFAAAERFGQAGCGGETLCLPQDLALTPAQERRLKALRAQERAEREALRARLQAAMLQVLTPEQRARLHSRGALPAPAARPETTASAF